MWRAMQALSGPAVGDSTLRHITGYATKDKDEEERARRCGSRPTPAATVYTVKNDAGEQRHFTVEDDQVIGHASYQAAFGPMLFELHPTLGFEHRGGFCRYHRYSLC